jgi:hypothetical protein
MLFSFQHAKRAQATGDVMRLCRTGTGLTADQSQLILPKTDHFLNLGPEAIQVTNLRSRERQAIGGVVLFAVSDNQYFNAPGQPADFGPLRVPPMRAHCFPVEVAIFLDPTPKRPAVVSNTLQELFGGIPRIEEDIFGATVHAVTRITQ